MGEGRVEPARSAGHDFRIGLARAFGGAILIQTVVLGFPAALGAAAARLIL